eukprot:TRINITY_DN7409_c0_g3_i3.p1 TRINITY_DN7409_c0_g3~~TRINITY_DN7409_c0_g3_i3.p1  ORF type:complete len:299 (-),score=73.32 TRINITY_DN7409_c0_g3_i3:171-1067(-)
MKDQPKPHPFLLLYMRSYPHKVSAWIGKAHTTEMLSFYTANSSRLRGYNLPQSQSQSQPQPQSQSQSPKAPGTPPIHGSRPSAKHPDFFEGGDLADLDDPEDPSDELIRRRLDEIYTMQQIFYEWDRCLGLWMAHPLHKKCRSCVGFRITKDYVQTRKDLATVRRLYELEDRYLGDEGFHLRISNYEASFPKDDVDPHHSSTTDQESSSSKPKIITKEQLREAQQQRMAELEKKAHRIVNGITKDAYVAWSGLLTNSHKLVDPYTYTHCAELIVTSVTKNIVRIASFISSKVSKGTDD